MAQLRGSVSIECTKQYANMVFGLRNHRVIGSSGLSSETNPLVWFEEHNGWSIAASTLIRSFVQNSSDNSMMDERILG